MMRETLGNMLFFTTYETTRYYLFGALGLDPNRARAARKDETVPARPMVANTLLEAGVGIVTGGLAGVAVSELLTNELLGFLINVDLSKFFHHLLPIVRPSFAHDLSICQIGSHKSCDILYYIHESTSQSFCWVQVLLDTFLFLLIISVNTICMQPHFCILGGFHNDFYVYVVSVCSL
jgi:hypothetical protein